MTNRGASTTAPASPRAQPGGMALRAKLTLTSLVLVVLTMIGLVPFILVVTALPLFVVWLGVPMFIGALLLLRLWCDGARWLAGSIGGNRVPRPYRPLPRGRGPAAMFSWLRVLLTDPATWRDLLWVLVSCTVGFTLATLVLTLFGAALFYLAMPLLLAVTPPGIFNDPLGPLVVLDHWTEGFWMWPVAGLVVLLWWVTTPGLMTGWAVMTRALLGPTRSSRLQGRVDSLSTSRAETRDAAAAELRRIERDLHDGVQVRLASLGMNLGLVEQLIRTDPERARALLASASEATTSTMQELRALVRGIHPPVLADRGLVGAVRSLVLDTAVPTTLTVHGFDDPADADGGRPRRLEAPVETCLYFGVAEALANVVKHSGATRAGVELTLRDGSVSASVTDDGHGGATVGAGSGLAGIERRLRAFDGSLHLASPVGGPTTVTLEMPCEPSSPKTTPSSEKV